MSDIETLAEDERECLLAVAGIPDGDGVAEKSLRIIDALTAENERLRAADRDAAQCIRRVSDLRDAAEARVREIEATIARVRAAIVTDETCADTVVWLVEEALRGEMARVHAAPTHTEGEKKP